MATCGCPVKCGALATKTTILITCATRSRVHRSVANPLACAPASSACSTWPACASDSLGGRPPARRRRNAAIHYDTWQQASTADLQVVREALEVNLLGAWQTSLSLLPLLRASGHGRIVNVSSEAGSLASMNGGPPAYNVSKAALNALTRMLAGELRRDRILVNAVCPGWVATDMGGPGGRPVAEGAASVLWAVDLPDDGPTGGFYRDGHPVPW